MFLKSMWQTCGSDTGCHILYSQFCASHKLVGDVGQAWAATDPPIYWLSFKTLSFNSWALLWYLGGAATFLWLVAPFYRPTFAENDILITINKCQSSIILLEYSLNCHGKVAMKCQLMCWSFILHSDIFTKPVRSHAELTNSTMYNVAA